MVGTRAGSSAADRRTADPNPAEPNAAGAGTGDPREEEPSMRDAVKMLESMMGRLESLQSEIDSVKRTAPDQTGQSVRSRMKRRWRSSNVIKTHLLPMEKEVFEWSLQCLPSRWKGVPCR